MPAEVDAPAVVESSIVDVSAAVDAAASVAELAEPFEISQPAISRHLKVLERAGLIARAIDAQRRPRRLQPQPLAQASRWIENYRQFWEESFSRLDAVLEEIKSAQARKKRKRAAAR